MYELLHEKNNLYYLSVLLPSLLLFFEVKCNYPLCGMGPSSDTGVKVSQLDVDQAHQPQGGLSRLEPLYATEYSCPLQYPRVVSVYPAMLIAQHRREGSTRWNGSLSDVEISPLKCLHLRWRISSTEHLMWHGLRGKRRKLSLQDIYKINITFETRTVHS